MIQQTNALCRAAKRSSPMILNVDFVQSPHTFPIIYVQFQFIMKTFHPNSVHCSLGRTLKHYLEITSSTTCQTHNIILSFLSYLVSSLKFCIVVLSVNGHWGEKKSQNFLTIPPCIIVGQCYWIFVSEALELWLQRKSKIDRNLT